MEPLTVIRALRALRRRKGISQRQLGQRLGISQPEVSRRERSGLGDCSVVDLRAWATALGAYISLDLRVDGERPLADARHAELQAWLAALLRAAGWLVEVEVSFNHYGERGRIDLLAYHPGLRLLLVVEVKTQLTDAQDVLGTLDRNRRIAAELSRQRGWFADATIPALVVSGSRTARRRVRAHAPLFAHLPLRARAAAAWLRRPTRPAPPGILLFADPIRAAVRRVAPRTRLPPDHRPG